MFRLHAPVPAATAASQSPHLQQLLAQSQRAQACLLLLRTHLPPMLRNNVQAGPIQDGELCLLVKNAAAAAKIRHLTPSLLAQLHTKGEPIQSLRIKVVV